MIVMGRLNRSRPALPARGGFKVCTHAYTRADGARTHAQAVVASWLAPQRENLTLYYIQWHKK